MKVGDYVKVGDSVLYLNEDISKDDLNFLEFKAIVIYTEENHLDFFVGKVCRLFQPKNDPIEPVIPIFVKDEKQETN
jgi:hypothetical protein